MEKELLFLFNAEQRWCRERGVGGEPGELDPFSGATDFVHNIDWIGGGTSLPWHLRPHPRLQPRTDILTLKRRAAPLQSRVTANSARKKRAARAGGGGFKKRRSLTYLFGFYHKLERAELTRMKLNVRLCLLGA